jgi:DNA sulfur modification protein DndD
MMKFLKLSLNNFMPFYGDYHEITFPTDSQQNILLIHGSNTYGKTSILRSIKWVLYGRAFDKYNRQLAYLDLLNYTSANNSDYEFEVIIEFEANSHHFQIIRNVSVKDTIQIPQNDSDFNERVFLKKDGDVLKGSEIVHEISLIAPEAVSRFFLFDGELLQEYEDLLEEGSKAGMKIKESIEQILGVPSLINGKDDTSYLSKIYRTKQKKELKATGDTALQIASRTSLEEAIETHEAEIERLSIQSSETKLKKETIETEILDLEKKSKVAEKIQITKSLISTLENQIITLKEKRLAAAALAWKTLLKPKLLIAQKESLNNVGKFIKEFERIGALKKELDLLETIHVDHENCDICNTEVSAKNESSYQNRIHTLKNEIDSIEINTSDFSKMNNQYDSINSLLQVDEDRSLKDIDTELSNRTVQLSKEESNYDGLKDQIGDGLSASEILVKSQKVGSYARTLSDIEDQIKKEREKIISADKQIELINKLIDKNQDSDESPSTKYVSLFDNLHNLFDDSVSNLRDELKNEVEEKASEAFLKLIHRDNYSALKINDNYGLHIVNQNNQIVAMKSSGAEQIVALSLIDALSKTGRPSGPVVMDTPFGRLDPEHRVKILEYLPTSASQLILFVHKGETDNEILRKIAGQIGIEYNLKLQDDKENSLLEKIN